MPDRYSIAFATGKIIVLVFPSCILVEMPSADRMSVVIVRFWTSGISSGVTSQGPNGPKVSQLFAFVSPAAFCQARSDTSFMMQNPAT